MILRAETKVNFFCHLPLWTMAAANPLQSLQEEATCSICLEYYKDPVTTKCGHNFCHSCISVCSQGSEAGLPCPQCREVCPRGDVRPNRQLQTIVQIAKQLSVQPERPKGESLCEEHEEKLKLFCEEDGKLICVLCRESSSHRSHTVYLTKEAAMKYKDMLGTEKQKTVAEFARIRQLLREQEREILGRLEEMEGKITAAEKAKIDKLSQQISSLSALITEIEKKQDQPAEELLKDVRSTLSRCEKVRFREPKKYLINPKGNEEHVDNWRVLGQERNIKSRKGKGASVEELKIQNPDELIKKYKVPVTLDPGTAHRRLTLSEGGRRVTWTSTEPPPADNSRRFTCSESVLGREGFSSGRHYWEVEVLQEGLWGGWIVGFSYQSVNAYGVTTLSNLQIWGLKQWRGKYMALASSTTALSPRHRLMKLGLYLDYEGGLVSLYNADTMEELYTFTDVTFRGALHPYFSLWYRADMRLV
ncbi:zinc finger protein RFP-like isoform X2 [Ambystoma mexicanum]|uniref:zinc finger protein RFP-like isoform X2 n=1 Tax=Ambystoma mexicanum TaxID=8296 RepID=UPI0037E8445B